MVTHKQRTLGALLGFAALFAEPWLASTLGLDVETAGVVFQALLALIATAVGIDFLAIERRRRDPHVPALPDDYRQPLVPRSYRPPEAE